MPNVNELKRNAKNIIKKYSDAQVKVREATSNDPWGPSSTIMAEIADMTYNVVAFSEIMQMIWKRLNDHGKYWRHVFKALVLLEYLIKTGSDKVAQQCIENIFAIQALKDFQYFEPCENYVAKDHGHSVRDKSKKLVALLKDPERLKAERERAIKAKSRLIEAVSSSGKSHHSSFGSRSMMGSSRSSNGSGGGDIGANSSNSSGSMINSNNNNNNNNNSFPSFADGDGGNCMSSGIDSARPQSLNEEETQLQIALALSKEEAERQEATRKNDELRLKLALDVSKQTGTSSGSVGNTSNHFLDDFPSVPSSTSSQQQQPQSHKSSSSKLNKQSNIDDLLGLSFTPPLSTTTSTTSHQKQSQLNTLSQGPFSVTSSSSPPVTSTIIATAKPEPHNDPWGSIDPWGSTMVSTSALPSQGSSMSSLQQVIPQILNPKGTITNTNTTATTTTAAAFPTTTQPVKLATSTPNQFPLSDMDSIFGGLGVDFGSGINQNAASTTTKKVISKNPFED